MYRRCLRGCHVHTLAIFIRIHTLAYHLSRRIHTLAFHMESYLSFSCGVIPEVVVVRFLCFLSEWILSEEVRKVSIFFQSGILHYSVSGGTEGLHFFYRVDTFYRRGKEGFYLFSEWDTTLQC